jgi:ribosomal protein S18 acetylase RimI-like enzyme
MSILIRKAQRRDAAIIAEYNIAMALETENKALQPEVVHAGVLSLFDQPQAGFYVVAEVDGEIAGCLMITTEWSDWRNGIFWWVQSVYIAPDYRRQGLYSTLYLSIKEMAKDEMNVCGFRLYVDKDNGSAQKTYEKLGMEPMHYLMYEELVEKTNSIE